MFKVDKLNVNYGDIQVLWDVSFTVGDGEVVAIVGGNGAGKTTIVKTISGLVKPKSGSIEFNGVEIGGTPCTNCLANGVVLVPEGRQLFTNMTVLENLEMGAFSKEAKAKKRDMLERVYTWFPILKERKNQTAGTFSGGEQQMVAIARGMMSWPKLLMLDEPSLGLAPNIVDNILSVAKEVSKEGISVILVEQDVKKALKVADKGYVLENGVIQIKGTAKELLVNENVKKAYLGF